MPPARAALATAVAVPYAWWATGLPPFSPVSTLAVVAAGTVAMALGSRTRCEPQRSRLGRRDLATWGALLGALAAWQLAAYLQQPRREHPTLSSLTGAVLDTHPERTMAFLLWLLAAARLGRR